MIDGLVEEYANTMGVDAARFNYLKRPLTGTLATKQGAIEVLSKLSDFLKSDANRVISQNNSTPSDFGLDLPGGAPQVQQPGGQTQGEALKTTPGGILKVPRR